jgi:dTDP-4-dehydrorhamnose reductase
MNYAEYIAENLDKNIDYAEYIAENLGKNIDYAEYIAENLGYDGKSKKQILRETRVAKLKKLSKTNVNT